VKFSLQMFFNIKNMQQIKWQTVCWLTEITLVRRSKSLVCMSDGLLKTGVTHYFYIYEVKHVAVTNLSK
jgi:hypothetical protein